MTDNLLTPAETPQVSAQLVELLGPIIAEIKRLEERSKLSKTEAEAADQQIIAIRAQLATLAGSQAETVKALVVGRYYDGKGIYMGRWQPDDRDWNSLHKTFNVYAAPTDLQDGAGKRILLQFKEAVAHVAQLRDWHGRDGFACSNDALLYRALADGTGIGKWFIPPKELLCGANLNGNGVHVSSLFALRKTGDFNGTFGESWESWYWSCSEHRDIQSLVWATRPSVGMEALLSKGNSSVSKSDYRVLTSVGMEALLSKGNARLSSRVCFVELII